MPVEKGVYAVIFVTKSSDNRDGYEEMAERMLTLAAEQPGYIGVDSVSDGAGSITVSYWQDRKAIENWRKNAEHAEAQAKGRAGWYQSYDLHITKVKRTSTFSAD